MELYTEIPIDAPAADAWRFIGEQFADIGDWISLIRGSSMHGKPQIGAVRTCYLDGSTCATEVLTEFDPQAMRLAYVATSGTPAWVRQAGNRWSVQPLAEGRCLICSRAFVQPVWWAVPVSPLLHFGLRWMLGRAGEEIRYAVEHGSAHPRKQAQAAADKSPEAG